MNWAKQFNFFEIEQLIDSLITYDMSSFPGDIDEKLLIILKYGYAMRAPDALKYAAPLLDYANQLLYLKNFHDNALFKAFYAIQISRYLHHREKLYTKAEEFMIKDLIAEEFLAIEPAIYTKNSSEILSIFLNKRIIFPFFKVKPHCYNFTKKQFYRGDDLCPCGSQLPFNECCNLLL